MYHLIKGEDRVLTIYCRDANGDDVDLTGKTIGVELPLVSGTVVKTGSIVDAPLGIFTITIADTDDLLIAQGIPIEVELTASGLVRIYPQADGLDVFQKSY